MQTTVLADAQAVAEAAADWIAAEAKAAIAARGRFVMAVSGGKTPWLMLARLAKQTLPWERVEIAQVDERIAPAGSDERNLTQLRRSFLDVVPIDPKHVHAMPVEDADPEAGARSYAATLATVAGSPPVIDLVHLGLGPDGHTASLIPGDPVLSVSSVDVALAGPYQGRRRMTLTYPAINRAARILWVITGSDKVDAFARSAPERSVDPGRPGASGRGDGLRRPRRCRVKWTGPVASSPRGSE